MNMMEKAKSIIMKGLAMGRTYVAGDKEIADKIFNDLKDAGYLSEMLIKDAETMEKEVIKARELEETAIFVDTASIEICNRNVGLLYNPANLKMHTIIENLGYYGEDDK